MSTPKQVSDYMREMQRRSTKSRWSGMSAAEKSAAMKAALSCKLAVTFSLNAVAAIIGFRCRLM